MKPILVQKSQRKGGIDKDKKKRSSINGVFPCSKCALQITFSSAELLAAHTWRFHSDLHQFDCPHCDKKFTREEHRNGHVLNVHERAMEKKHKCRWCEKAFGLKGCLNLHERTHTKEKPFQCVDCDAKFSRLGNLVCHQRIHSGEQPFACPVCEQTFRMSSHVRIHLRTHTGEKPYKCQFCEMSFICSSNRSKHERRHHK